MPSSAIIDLAIGLIFVFGVTAALASVFTEVVSRFIGLRGAYLLTGLRELVDSSKATTDLGKAQEDYRAMRELMQNGTVAQAAQPAPSVTGALLGGPILSSQGMVGQIQARNLTIEPEKRGSLHKMTADRQTGDRQTADQQTADQQKPTADQQKGGVWRQRRSLPAYFSGDSFAEAVIDLVAPDAAGETTMDTIQGNVRKLPDPFKSSLLALVKNADNDVSRFRTSVEHWYDDHMSRVSGWYKRRVAKITIVIGAILVLLLNINAITIGRTLYSNSVVRTAVSSVAVKTTSCAPGESTQKCLGDLQAQLSAATQAGLPIGWAAVADCAAPNIHCNWLDQRGILSRHGGSAWQVVLVLVGFLITVIALTPGARFWFDLLGKLGSLRSTGPKPAS